MPVWFRSRKSPASRLKSFQVSELLATATVRSILLLSRMPWKRVRTVAADHGSRTSVQLARVILRERFGVEARIAPHAPALEDMLATSDAALIIGDPALQIPLENASFDWLDLGAEWLALTDLPFVFAAWAGKPGFPLARIGAITRASYEFGKSRLLEIAEQEHPSRGISRDLAERYLTQHIRYEIAAREQAGLEAFLRLAGLPQPALASIR